MSANKNNNDQKQFEERTQRFFKKAEIPFEKSRDEVWEHISGKLQDIPRTNTAKISTERIVLSLAASLIILLSIGSFFRFYTNTIKVEAGEQLTYQLPDGSSVDLNSQSVLRYYPLWWNVSRQLSFEGEAFFKVTKGSTFSVTSIKGRTEVLGTSFNIYSRPNAYKVNCITGKVKVSNKAKEEVILTPDYQASIAANGSITVQKNTNTEQTISWKDGMFNFTATPLQEVIHEIERQYNVQIIFSAPIDLTYTGFFSREYALEDVLKVVCKPFNLKYTKKKENIYEISN